jgi:pyrimidine-nucleoside phosphorylase
MYALRDATATVNNMSLIASSIMSKKIADGVDAIVLDVKTGSGAFMKKEEDARHLAHIMVDIGKSLGRKTVAVVSNMDQPLGKAIGNALEVKEAIETLKGNGPKDLEEISLVLGAYMLKLGGRAEEIDILKDELRQYLHNGKALQKFREMVINQEGNAKYIDNPSLFKEADFKIPVKARKDGYIASIKADEIGTASMILGAGREDKDSQIELDVGIVLEKKVGDYVTQGDIIAWMHANSQEKANTAEAMIQEACRIENEKPVEKPLIIDII